MTDSPHGDIESQIWAWTDVAAVTDSHVSTESIFREASVPAEARLNDHSDEEDGRRRRGVWVLVAASVLIGGGFVGWRALADVGDRVDTGPAGPDRSTTTSTSAPRAPRLSPLSVEVGPGDVVPTVNAGPVFTQMEGYDPSAPRPDPATYVPEDVTMPAPTAATAADQQLAEAILSSAEDVGVLTGRARIDDVRALEVSASDRIVQVVLTDGTSTIRIDRYSYRTAAAVIPAAGTTSSTGGSYVRSEDAETFQHDTVGGRNLYFAPAGGTQISVIFTGSPTNDERPAAGNLLTLARAASHAPG